MLNREAIIRDIEAYKIIVIMRGLTKEQLVCTVEAMEKGGIRLVEVTFDQSGKTTDAETAEAIRTLREAFDGRVHVGAGTVMTPEQVRLAYEAGAEYIISPDACEEIIKLTRELGMVSIPGVFTPTEAAMAHRWGADFVKLFPNSEVKLSYLKCLTVPLSHIRFLAVGGVNADNLAEYLAAGAKGIGVATAIVNKTAIAAGEYGKITEYARAFTEKLEG